MSTTASAPTQVRLPSFPLDVESALVLLHPIFRECMDTDYQKYDVTSPWIIEDTVYATDGRIMVWEDMSSISHWCTARNQHTARVVEAIHGNGKPRLTWDVVRKNIPPWELYHPEPIDPPSLDDEPVCSGCEGQRVRPPHRCDECNAWTVGLACNQCYGTGREERIEETGEFRSKTIAPGCVLSFRFVDLLLRHKARLYVPLDVEKTRPIRFKVSQSGVEGVVMPLDRSNS